MSLLDPQDIKRAVRLEDVVAFVYKRPLYGNGSSELRCQCWRPGHPDTVPSCRINVKKQAFFCDVCGSGGDVFTVVRERFGKSFPQSVQWLAEHRIPTAVIQELPHGSRTNGKGRAATHGEWAVYRYFGTHWEVLFEKVRTPDKLFFYRHRDGRNQ